MESTSPGFEFCYHHVPNNRREQSSTQCIVLLDPEDGIWNFTPQRHSPGVIPPPGWKYTEIALYQKDGLQALDTYLPGAIQHQGFLIPPHFRCPAGNWQGGGGGYEGVTGPPSYR